MSATDALTDLRMAKERTMEAQNVAVAMKWSVDQQDALADAHAHIVLAMDALRRALAR